MGCKQATQRPTAPVTTAGTNRLQPPHLLLVPALVRRHLGQERGGAAAACRRVHKLDDQACRCGHKYRPRNSRTISNPRQQYKQP